MTMARCLIAEKKNLLKRFWAESTTTFIYLLNKLSTNSLSSLTIFKAWFDNKFSLSHLKAFDNICYALMLKSKRTKLDHKATPAIFVGYLNKSTNYKIYDVIIGKISISRDLKFHESEKWN
uniref:Retrovirus-related Pol polyprotein from transposon TNT 1-94 n=1 Tax=Rhizophora mucronata TaxID=61149 RepID=A0A2P2JV48_RHIMU